MANLTAADETEHRIIFREAGQADRKVCAAYVTTEDKHPDMLAFKDHRNRTVLLVSREPVLAVERVEQQGGCADSGSPVTSQGAAGVPSSLSTYWTGNLGGAAGVTLTRIRCHDCRLDVPVECGDVTGMDLDRMITAATQQAVAECPAHDVIKVGVHG